MGGGGEDGGSPMVDPSLLDTLDNYVGHDWVTLSRIIGSIANSLKHNYYTTQSGSIGLIFLYIFLLIFCRNFHVNNLHVHMHTYAKFHKEWIIFGGSRLVTVDRLTDGDNTLLSDYTMYIHVYQYYI